MRSFGDRVLLQKTAENHRNKNKAYPQLRISFLIILPLKPQPPFSRSLIFGEISIDVSGIRPEQELVRFTLCVEFLSVDCFFIY